MEEEEQGVTLGDICKVVFKRVWWVVGAIALGIILAALLVQFWYNKNNRTYSVTYQIVYETTQDGKYPDGSTFVMSDLVSEEALKTVMDNDTDGKFDGVDIEKIIDGDGVTIEDVTEDSTETLKSYTLTLSAKYFSSREQAASFIRELADYPIEYKVVAGVKSKGYDTYLTAYDLADTYEEMIAALTAQAEYIDEYYDTLIELYGMEYQVTVDGQTKTLGQWQLEAAAAFSTTKADNLSASVTNNYYATQDYLDNLASRKQYLNNKITENTTVINAFTALAGATGQTTISDTEITALVIETAEMQNELTRIGNEGDTEKSIYGEKSKYTTSGTSEYTAFEAFKESLAESYTALAEKAAETQEVVTSLYTASSKIAYANSGTVKVDGGINIILAALIGAVLGLIVAAIVICIIDMPAYKREKYGVPAPVSSTSACQTCQVSQTSQSPADSSPAEPSADPADKKKE